MDDRAVAALQMMTNVPLILSLLILPLAPIANRDLGVPRQTGKGQFPTAAERLEQLKNMLEEFRAVRSDGWNSPP
jgi:hypothetical protein